MCGAGTWGYWLIKVIPQLAAKIALHHLFIIKVPFALKSLDGVVCDIIGVTLGGGATCKAERGNHEQGQG